MKTYVVKPTDIHREWYVVDATGKTLGRLASEVAKILHGKHKTTYTPHLDTGDFVIVVNSNLIHTTGHKMADKMYYRHSGYPGGFRTETLADMMENRSDRVIYFAVRGMLPHNRLGKQMIKKLKIYPGSDHPHAAQQPKALEI